MKPKSIIKSIGKLAKEMKRLAARAGKEYAPVVDSIVRSRTKDTRHIEQTLDGLLDFCWDPATLRLFKKLCRYYYTIDPKATVEYINAYRNIWDEK